MKRAPSTLFLGLYLTLSLACGGLLDDEAPQPEPEPCPADDPCCDPDDVLLMDAMGISDEGMIAAIESDTLEVEVGDEGIARLQQAGIAQEVIDALVGEEEPEPTAKAQEAPKVPLLDVSMTYDPGARSFVLNNHSGTTYTALVLTANGEYVYRLGKLPVGAEDSIRLASFSSRSSGQALDRKEGIESMYISADQGAWSKRF